MTYSNWREEFTKPSPRKYQDQALDKISEELDKPVEDGGKKFVVAEIPVGVGKSDIAVTLSKCTDNAYIATSLNVLVDQYIGDFKKESYFKDVKGAKNYECPQYGDCRIGVDRGCDHAKEPGEGELDYQSNCGYKFKRNNAIKSQLALTNLTYFALAVPRGIHWQQRKLAVIDEGHNLANEVLNLVSITIDDTLLPSIGVNFEMNSDNNPFLSKVYEKGEQVPTDEFFEFVTHLHNKCEEYIVKNADKEDMATVAIMEACQDLIGKINYFFSSYDENVEWITTFNVVVRGKNKQHVYHTLVAQPLYASWFADKIFFTSQAERYLIQSATIIDPNMYMKELGILDQSKYISVPTPFDVNKLRPAFCMNTGNMTHKEIGNTMKNILDDTRLLIDCYKGKKGLVHTVSYDVQKKMSEFFEKNPRCLFMNNSNKEEMLKKFDESEDCVLFSPALTEGFDGKGDRLRFQIMVKIPYPSLGDLRIKIKAGRARDWYLYETKKPIIQAVGRGMRSEDDWCDFYMLDSAFENFVYKNMPKEFQETVVPDRQRALTRASKIYRNLV